MHKFQKFFNQRTEAKNAATHKDNNDDDEYIFLTFKMTF
jgi:hypothetical protein